MYCGLSGGLYGGLSGGHVVTVHWKYRHHVGSGLNGGLYSGLRMSYGLR